jgi:hypothetical protein
MSGEIKLERMVITWLALKRERERGGRQSKALLFNSLSSIILLVV